MNDNKTKKGIIIMTKIKDFFQGEIGLVQIVAMMAMAVLMGFTIGMIFTVSEGLLDMYVDYRFNKMTLGEKLLLLRGE